MFKPFCTLSLLCLTLSVTSLHAQAAAAPLPETPLHTIAANAAAAHSNASIYQWKRVDLEVRRIAAAQKQIEQSSAANAEFAARIAPLSEAVRTLRAGSQSHDSARTQAAADRVAVLCTALLH